MRTSNSKSSYILPIKLSILIWVELKRSQNKHEIGDLFVYVKRKNSLVL